MSNPRPSEDDAEKPAEAGGEPAPATPPAPRETGGRADGTDPTRYGDWEKNGRCIDF